MLQASPRPAVPVLRTERLRLVGLEPRHFEAFAALHADPETMRYIGDGRPLDRTGAWFHLAMLVGHWALRGYGVWAVEEAETGELVGRVGLLHPEGWDAPELNWMVAPSRQGRGYATEATRAALAFAWQQLRVERLMSLVRPGNAPSLRLVTRLGGTWSGTVDFLGAPMQVYRYTRPR